MNIDLLCVGKLKEKYLLEAIKEYSKRLSRYCKLNIIEVADEKTPEDQGELLNEKVKKLEGERILKYIKDNSFLITLEIDGSQLESTEFAGRIKDICIRGYSHIQFVIGGSLGLSEEVTGKADMHLSFSKMTFPHQLMRVILLEQIYRCFRINYSEPYHK
ncbi:MAG: 23S rRNA (pseudouridine(1915)-N(3))-methyltransferase RlmH [Lachnospiraceae bacterium]|nr:23S rRNA (pseudouridine(1915)-N(3))-methyltransferase RlmH [Lachnospiraceae bacterium]